MYVHSPLQTGPFCTVHSLERKDFNATTKTSEIKRFTFVPDYGEEVCADPGKGYATLGVGGPGPQQGTVRVSWSQTGEEERRSKMTEDIEDGSFTASRDSYAQS